ncbi:MAG: hydroxypyruvate isomerase [Actinomycetota bacterium]|nr:hydroxypyruvate isomerase [Actinomycetota bacterium]
MPRFAANLTMLFTEHPFLERFAAAAESGFTHVEFLFPYEHPADEVRTALDEAGLAQVLFNLPAGEWGAGDRGIAADPGRVDEFRAGVDTALEYAAILDCRRLNCLAGLRLEGVARDAQWDTLVDNVRYAAGRVAGEDRTLLVEPVNDKDVEGFLLPRTDDVIALLDEVGDPSVRLQFDIYHVQRMEGDVTARLRTLLPRIAHLQVADNPGRHQPGTGELNFQFLFDEIDRLGYDGFVGLEYSPQPDTVGSLAWLERPQTTSGA